MFDRKTDILAYSKKNMCPKLVLSLTMIHTVNKKAFWEIRLQRIEHTRSAFDRFFFFFRCDGMEITGNEQRRAERTTMDQVSTRAEGALKGGKLLMWLFLRVWWRGESLDK